MSNSLYMLKCSNRSYSARYTVILITSRDFSHITWSRNSASVSLLATLSHKTWVANDISSSQLSQKRSKRLRLHFLKIFLQTKNFFLIHLLYAKSTLKSDRKLYKKRWCDQMRTWSSSFHWTLIHYWAFTDYCRETRWLLSRNDSDSFHRLVSRSDSDSSHRFVSRDDSDSFYRLVPRDTLVKVSAAERFIRSLVQRETERICLWSVIWLDRQLSFDRWARRTDQ